MPWAGLQAAAAAAVTAAQDLLGAAQRVSAAVAGTTATADPAALAARLSDLTALRLAVCPDPITPADRAMYFDRMNELDLALTGLLGAPAGVPATVPLVMPPVSIQVRTRPGAHGGTDFRIRVYPDSFHVNAHDPRLTADEAQWSQHLAAAAAANGGILPQAEWAQAAARFGPARTAYLLHPDTNAGTRPGPWAQPATATALPDRWLAIGYGPDGSPLAAALGQPIPRRAAGPWPGTGRRGRRGRRAAGGPGGPLDDRLRRGGRQGHGPGPHRRRRGGGHATRPGGQRRNHQPPAGDRPGHAVAAGRRRRAGRRGDRDADRPA